MICITNVTKNCIVYTNMKCDDYGYCLTDACQAVIISIKKLQD